MHDTFISKYNLSILYVTGMYVFIADRFMLENQLLCISLGRTSFPAPSFPQWSIVLPIGLRLRGLFPTLFACLLLSCLFILFLGSHVDETMGVASDVTDSQILWLLQSPLPCFMPGTGNLANSSVLVKLLLFLISLKMFQLDVKTYT